ncbi:Lar family restriction alleviation protein [Caballeronia sp. AZ10_KS36]|uniref:Lar family restriction alleviation protein n=1 Tax=Caballeronia sp. AZ10_KS36 TaxID=2921757 RepID=UPI002028E07B|nr:Lar family restriction alleviation protein [Caballeronia sp. AZ10_KS36]
MTDELFPCDHCGGKWSFGFSQRLVGRPSAPERDFARLGNSLAPPMQDMEPRSPYDVPYEKVCCIFCEECGMQTPWIPIGNDRYAALDKAGEIWNARMRRPKATEGDLLQLVRKEVSAVDDAYLIDLLSRNEDDWEKRGPIFQMLAKKIADSKITMSEFWPVDTVLRDAARYRKLQQLAKRIYIDGIASVQFPRIPATGGDEGNFENSVNEAVDDLPDRNRW